MEKRHSPPASRFFAIKSKFLRAASVLAALAAAALATSVSPLLSDSMAGTAESCFGKQSERNSTRKRNPESGSPAATLILFFLTELTTDQRQFTLICEAFSGATCTARSTALVQFTVRNRLLFNHLSNHSITKLHFLLSVTRLTNEPALARGHFLETGPQQTVINSRNPFNNPFRNRTTLLNAQTILHKNTLPGRTGHGSLILEVKVFAFRRRQHPATEQNHFYDRSRRTANCE